MLRKFTTMLAASALALAALAPVEASAQHWRYRDYGGDAYGCRDDNNYGCERDRDRRAARRGYGYGGYGDGYYDRRECYDRYGRNHCYDRDDDDDNEAIAAGVIGLVLGAALATAVANDRHDDDDYRECTRQERRWDRRRQRYVYVDVPC